MEIKEMQKQVFGLIEDHNKKNNITHNKDATFPHLVEELGELAREIYNEKIKWRDNFNKDKFQEELIDVLIQLSILANDYSINIEEQFKKRISELRKRFELNPTKFER